MNNYTWIILYIIFHFQENTNALISLRYKLVDYKGKTYLKFSAMHTKISLADYTVVLKMRNGKSNALTDTVNEMIKINRKEIMHTIVPFIERIISKKLMELANRICKHFTYDELFPFRE